ncbi:MAG: hypothetical protein C4524_04295 [Candidatus Zixiibacteriota bacterium]|nr:MAG: hypothetical protein C4524_04295 [candidate division Zixibacteria bacterium]
MKSRAILWLMLIAAVLYMGCTTEDDKPTGPDLPSGTPLAGEKTGVLEAEYSPYLVTGDIVVPEGQSLTIEPGVELRFDGLHKFLVQGHLEAIGTAENNIVFTSVQGAAGNGDYGQWRALVLDTGADTARLEYCLVQYGAAWDSTERYPEEEGLWLNGGIFIWNCSPVIRNSTVILNGYNGIFILGAQSNPTLINNCVYDNDGDGVRCELGATANIWYNCVKENNSQQYAGAPSGIGVKSRLNANGDSCDFHYNISLDPKYADYVNQDYTLGSCSALIQAGQDAVTIGSIPYYVGATELRGPIGGRTLTAAASPWYVSCNAFVDEGETLVVQPGAQVLFQGVYDLKVFGTLQAEGATFMHEDSLNEQAFWLGILLTNTSGSDSYLRDCHFRNASSILDSEPFGGAVTVQGVSPDLTGNTFHNSLYAAISCQNAAQPLIRDNVIDGFGPMAINCVNNSHPQIDHNVIRNGIGYGIQCLFNSRPVIETNLIYATGMVGIRCAVESSPVIRYNTLVQHEYSGIVCTDQSNPSIRNNIVAFNGSPSTWSVNSHGNGISIAVSSVPQIYYNDVYQSSGSLFSSGLTVDPSNLSSDPLFVDAEAGNFHLQSSSPCKTASETGGEIGAYGLDSNW